MSNRLQHRLLAFHCALPEFLVPHLQIRIRTTTSSPALLSSPPGIIFPDPVITINHVPIISLVTHAPCTQSQSVILLMISMVRFRVSQFLVVSFFVVFVFLLLFDHHHSRSNHTPSSSSSVTNPSSSALSNSQFNDQILSSVFISVKTTGKFHRSRVDRILQTWFPYARHQIYFFTDREDKKISNISNGHLIQTNCSSSHNRQALCCKMSVELDTFVRRDDHKWFCHFDDDNFVNINRLIELVQQYDPNDDWYLGKPSIRVPLQIIDRKTGVRIAFWFATGGAGFCLSKSLVLKMVPFAGGGKFIRIGEKIRLPDDVTIGYIVEYLLRRPLTVVEQFHSHLEPGIRFLSPERLSQQISYSFNETIDENFESNEVK